MAHRQKTKGGALPARVKRSPSAVELLRQGNVLRRAGELARAEELYRRSVQSDSCCADAWAELGCCLLENESYIDEAVHCFRRVLSISEDPTRPSHRRKTPEVRECSDCGDERNCA